MTDKVDQEALEELEDEVSHREETEGYDLEITLRELAVQGGYMARRLARESGEQGEEVERHGHPI